MLDKTKLAKAYPILGEATAPMLKEEPKRQRDIRVLIEEQTRQICKATGGKPVLTIEDIVRVLGISSSTAYKFINTEDIPVMTIGKRKLIAAAVLAEMLVEGRKI